MTDDEIQKTTIQVSRDTHQQLTELKEWGDSFDDVISRLLDIYAAGPSGDTANEPPAANSQPIDSETRSRPTQDETDSDNNITEITPVEESESSEASQSENSHDADAGSSPDQRTNAESDDEQVSITYFDT